MSEFKNEDKRAINTFFSRYASNLKERIRLFASQNHRLPQVHEFINNVDEYIRSMTVPFPQGPLTAIPALLTAPNMRENADFINGHLQKLACGICVPSAPRPAPPPAPAAKAGNRSAPIPAAKAAAGSAPRPATMPAAGAVQRADGAILADGSPPSQSAIASRLGLTTADAAACSNTNGMSASTLRGDLSASVFYHNTVHSDNSTFGARDDDGIHKITCIYMKEDDHHYLVGIAKHDGTERRPSRRDPLPKYKVQASLIPELKVGDTLRFR